MITSVVLGFPADWRFAVTVKRGGGLDRFNKPIPSTTHTVADCLIGSASTDEVEAFSAVATLDAVLYAPVGSDFRGTDQIQSPATTWRPAAKWRAAGDPIFTPLGTKVPLSKDVG